MDPDPEPKWVKIPDPGPISIYLDPQHCFYYTYTTVYEIVHKWFLMSRVLTGWVLPVNTQLLKLVKGRRLLLSSPYLCILTFILSTILFLGFAFVITY